LEPSHLTCPENKNKDEVRAEEISTKGATPDLNNPRTKSLMEREGIVKLSEFDQNLGHTRIYHSLIVQDSGYWPETENHPNLT
jgi:hypothetical protein